MAAKILIKAIEGNDEEKDLYELTIEVNDLAPIERFLRGME